MLQETTDFSRWFISEACHFLISFFGILAVLFVSAIHTWALLGAAAMVASAIRCGLSWKEAGDAKQKLKRTFGGSIVMLAVFAAVFFLAPAVEQFALASAVFILVLLFVLCASRMP